MCNKDQGSYQASNDDANAKQVSIKIKSLHEQIAELKAVNERLAQFNVKLTAKCNWYITDSARLERERDEYKKDAERYRYIRSRNPRTDTCDQCGYDGLQLRVEDLLDLHIDAAMLGL